MSSQHTKFKKNKLKHRVLIWDLSAMLINVPESKIKIACTSFFSSYMIPTVVGTPSLFVVINNSSSICLYKQIK